MDFLLQGGLNGKHLAFMCEIEGKETGYGTKKDRKGLKMGENSDTRRWDRVWLWKLLDSSNLERIEEFSS